MTELANPAVAGPVPTVSILVTDDDRGSRDTLAQMLRDRGFSTITATSGEEAIEIIQVETIHLVFFDMHMPRMTGLEALQQVRVFNELLPAIYPGRAVLLPGPHCCADPPSGLAGHVSATSVATWDRRNSAAASRRWSRAGRKCHAIPAC